MPRLLQSSCFVHPRTSLIQLLAQFRIELVPVDRLIESDGSAFSLEIREDDGRPRTRVLARIVAEVRHDFASSDHIPSATSRCRLRSRSELIQYPAQIFAHFFFSVPAEVFSRRLSRLSVLMMNVQLQSGIVHLDLGHPYRRSAFAKIVSHPDVAGQKSVRGGLGDASCRGHRGKSPGISFSRSSIRRHRGDGGAEERRGKHDWKRGVHGCAANAVFLKRVGRSVGSEARPGRRNFFLETALFNIVLQEGTSRGVLTGGRSWTRFSSRSSPLRLPSARSLPGRMGSRRSLMRYVTAPRWRSF